MLITGVAQTCPAAVVFKKQYLLVSPADNLILTLTLNLILILTLALNLTLILTLIKMGMARIRKCIRLSEKT